MRIVGLLLGVFLGAACSGEQGEPSDPIPLSDLPPVDVAALLAHTTELAADRYEGRAPGTIGEELTVTYLEQQFRAMGLDPGTPDGTYIQPVPLVGITSEPAPLFATSRRGKQSFAWRDEFVATTRRVTDASALENSEIVFVGYGIVAPEYQWDDYKGLDVSGKTLLMLVNDPQVRSTASPSGLDPEVFGGPAMTYYGRWTYKYEIASEKGAAGVFLIHETEAAGYAFDVVQGSWSGEQFDLVAPDDNMSRVAVEGWLSLDAARRLLQFAQQDLDELRRASLSRDFRPVSLDVKASITLKNSLRTVNSRNVLALLPGSDPQLGDEAVVYTAHWDHLGVGRAENGDRIFNGALDNAVGVSGMLEIARAFTKLPQRPRRSIMFAAVTAEEQGLLGSRYYTENPTISMAKTAAAINIDTLNVHGPTSDLTIIGMGASDLDDYVRDALREQGRTAVQDATPETGAYYRSDHFNFAKAGVPAFFPNRGTTYENRSAQFGEQVRSEYASRIYHRPADEVDPRWDLGGAARDLQVFFAVGSRVANADDPPEWAAGNEFRAIREASIAADK
jgi:Zn-dependent M28 family amino/carboxypeptidase